MNAEVKRALGLALESLNAIGVPQEWDCRPVIRKALDQDERASPELVQQARELYEMEDVQIDDYPAIDRVEKGTWVQAWVWVKSD